MQDKLRSILHQAMKNKDYLRTETIRMMMAELTNKEKERGEPVNEQDVLRVFYSMLRKREDAINQYQKAKREDLAKKEMAEMDIIKEFLPQQLNEEEIRGEARMVIAELGVEDMKSMGKVMGILTKKMAGRAQGGVISKIVKEELSDSYVSN
ncbi:MAG: GatB/YqeY domain-containing protein [Deltaproteobacteria bacterium]|nr:GatB/YqeY domain-containing protein [Deltaproteobacteria bacterium]